MKPLNREQRAFVLGYCLFLIILGGLMAYASTASASEVTVRMTLPTDNCDGSAIAGTIDSVEIYSSPDPIPYDYGGGCGPADVPAPPDGFTPVLVSDPGALGADVDVPLDLTPGVTYYFRARVRVAGVWSALSNEVSETVALPLPGRPTIIVINP